MWVSRRSSYKSTTCVVYRTVYSRLLLSSTHTSFQAREHQDAKHQDGIKTIHLTATTSKPDCPPPAWKSAFYLLIKRALFKSQHLLHRDLFFFSNHVPFYPPSLVPSRLNVVHERLKQNADFRLPWRRIFHFGIKFVTSSSGLARQVRSPLRSSCAGPFHVSFRDPSTGVACFGGVSVVGSCLFLLCLTRWLDWLAGWLAMQYYVGKAVLVGV